MTTKITLLWIVAFTICFPRLLLGLKCDFSQGSTCAWEINGNTNIVSSLNGVTNSNTGTLILSSLVFSLLPLSRLPEKHASNSFTHATRNPLFKSLIQASIQVLFVIWAALYSSIFFALLPTGPVLLIKPSKNAAIGSGIILAKLTSPKLNSSGIQSSSCSLQFDMNMGQFDRGEVKVILRKADKEFEIQKFRGNDEKR